MNGDGRVGGGVPGVGDPADLPEIDDDEMRRTLAKARTYSVVILRHGPNYDLPHARAIIWEHGRRNMQLRESGILCVVLPIRDQGDLAGVGVFAGTVEQTRAIVDGDPAVAGEVLVAEVHEASGQPGDALPG